MAKFIYLLSNEEDTLINEVIDVMLKRAARSGVTLVCDDKFDRADEGLGRWVVESRED